MKSTTLILTVFVSLLFGIAAKSPVLLSIHRITNGSELPQKQTTNIARFLAGEFRDVLQLKSSDSLRLLSLLEDRQGGKHALVQQFHKGVPLYGAWYQLHERKGKLTSTRGLIVQDLNVNTRPAFTEALALEKALAVLPAQRYAWEDEYFEAALKRQKKDSKATFYPDGELVLVPADLQLFLGSPGAGKPLDFSDNPFLLAWVFDVFTLEPALQREQIFISATDGQVLYRLPQLARCHVPAMVKAAYIPGLVSINTDSCQAVPGLPYHLHDVLRNIEIFDANHTNGTPPIRYRNDTTLWIPPQADTVAIAAMHGLGLWYDFFADNFGWYGLDGQEGNAIQAWVHYRHNFENAVYSGFLLFGDGNPSGSLKKPLVTRDIVAHEASHGLIEHTARLLYVFEAGIINEAIADIFACLVELDQGNGNWMLAEDILPGGNRRLDAPNLAGLPDTYLGNSWVDQAYPDQALHHNSSVLGFWAFLLSSGGNGTNDIDTTYAVSPLGRRKVAELLFHTLRFYMNPNDGFFGLRRASLDAASDLNWSQEEMDNLAMAWCAIGVGGCNTQGNEQLSLLSPNGGEMYSVNEPVLLEWENSLGVTDLKVLISVNNGASWIELASFPVIGTSGSKLVTVPNINSRLCKMRVVALSDPLAFDESDSTFTIIGCDLLAAFTVTPESACFGTAFTVDNTSFETAADFSWEVDGLPYPATSGGFTLSSLVPGQHRIKLVAQNGICVDSFSRTIQVAPVPSADFNWAVSNMVLTAAASFSSAEQYLWSVNGQAMTIFNGSKSLIWTAPTPGDYELCLYIGDNCDVDGETFCQTITISATEDCVGTNESWTQYNNMSEIIDMAEYGDTLIMTTTGGLVYFNRANGQVVKVLNTANSELPCQDLGSVTIDPINAWAYVAILPDQGFVRVGLNDDSIVHFTTWNLPELLSNEINVLRTDPDGNLWIGTMDKGIWVGVPGISFQGTHYLDLPQIYSELDDKEVIDIDFSSDSSVWVAMRNSVVEIERNTVTMVYSYSNSPLPEGLSPALNSIMADGGVVWVGAVNGLHRLEAGNWDTFDSSDYGRPSNYIVDIEKGNNGKIVFGLFLNSILMEYDGSSFKEITCLYDAATTGAGGIKCLVLENDRIWAGCKNGLYSWDELSGCQKHTTDDFPIFRNSIEDLFIKSDGTVYVIEEQSAVKINDDIFTPLAIASYLPNGPSYLPYLNLRKMVEEENGILWASLDFYGFRLARISPLTGAWQFYSVDDLPFSVSISDIAFRDNKLYLVSREGLFIWDRLSDTWTTYNRENSPMWSYGEPRMAFDQEGNLWLSNASVLMSNNESDRLLKFDGQDWETLLVGNSSVSAFTFIPNGNVLVAQSVFNPPHFTKYIKEYRDGEWFTLNSITNLLNGDNAAIRRLVLDPSGNLLIGATTGLYKVDPEGNLMEHYTSCHSGLISNVINDLLVDDWTGAIWVATDKGAARLMPASAVIEPVFDLQEEVCLGVTAQFLNHTSGATSWEWLVDGVRVSTDRNLGYAFSEVGEHIVELVVFNAQGCAASVSRSVTAHPVANLTDLPKQIVECDAFWQICAPEGMAEYTWMRGSLEVGHQRCLNIGQNDSGVYELRITDFCGNVKKELVAITLSGACVWPGDLNNDGIVDFRDLLWLGYTFGYYGPKRTEQGINWVKYPAQDWNAHLPSDANVKFCDADGSGLIDLSDLEAILTNYLNIHGVDPGLPTSEQSPFGFVPVLDTVEADYGEQLYRLSIDIVARNATGVDIDNFYGAGMRMYFSMPPGVQLVETPTFSFHNSSLGIEEVNAIGLVKAYLDQGFMDVAFTRIDHQNQSGVDTLGRAYFIVADDHLPIFDSLQFTLSVVGGTAITNEGNFIPIDGAERTFTFTNEEMTVTEHPDTENEIRIYPNPTTGICQLKLPNLSAQEVSIQVLSTHKTEVWRTVIPGQTLSYELDLSDWSAGLYLLVLTIDDYRQVHKILKL